MLFFKYSGVYWKGCLHTVKTVSKRWRSAVTTQAPVLYADTAAPPARFVLMTARHLQTQLKLERVDLFRGEHMTNAYEEINPLRKVPVLVHGELIIRDSHAIALYLCENSQDRSLYPESLGTRAKIHQMMFYNSGVLFPVDSALMSEHFAGVKTLNQKLLNSWTSSLDYLEYNLKDSHWLSGNDMCLSDLCCAATVSSMGLLVPLDTARHPSTAAWIRRLQELPLYEVNRDGLGRLQEKINDMREQ